MAAIYQWFVGDEVVYTTTLYPIDVTESLQLSAVANPYGNLSNFPVDYATGDVTLSYIELNFLLLSGDTGEDYATGDVTLTFIEMVSLLQTGDTGEDYATGDVTLTYIEIVDMLVTCDTPDESLQLTCSTNAANSFLTPV